MKQQYQPLLLTALLFLSLATKAQKQEPVLYLKSGNLKTAHNITEVSVKDFNRKVVRYRDKGFAMLQFEKLPSTETRAYLSQHGIELLEYIPENAFTVSISGNLTAGILKKAGARTILQPSPHQKMHNELGKGNIPSWAQKVKGMVDVWISFPKTFQSSEVIQYLGEKKMEVLSTEHQKYRILEVRLPTKLVEELASFPFIEYVQAVPPPVQPLNMNSRIASRAGVLNASVIDGGKGLNGEGVVVGIGDNGSVQSHIDLSGPRLFDRLSEFHFPAVHAIHVSTTVAGGGIVNELNKGYAAKASLINSYMPGIIYDAGELVENYGMVLTNNSYGSGGMSCGNYGQYDFQSRMLDQQAFYFPYLQHVIAAGNDGGITCNTYPSGFHTVMGSFQAAKNSVTVGSTEWNGNLSNSSSKGPVKDGRLKPEITAQGVNVWSGSLNNSYTSSSGTSMAAPAVTGALALLYQRYRQLNDGANPKNGLMKALLCNGSTDLGNKGPDYSYGFGWMHLLRSVEMLEKEQYRIGSITNDVSQQYTISVPQNTAQVKVMLYWNDPPASILSSHTLVNDLDLTVADPSQSTNLPKVLDSTANGVMNAATTGVDRINNMEQVVIDNPTPGTYTINISGKVAENPSQEFFIVYDIIPISVTLTNPVGGQSLVPGESVQVNWDAYDDPASTFKLEYSVDNGTTWTTINNFISASTRRYEWVVPNKTTDQAIVRIERNGTSLSHTSQPFNILGVPSLSLSKVQCEGYASLSWSTVPGATDYEVMMKKGDEMVSLLSTNATSVVVGELSVDSVYWFSVRARNNGKPGRRAVAVSRQPKDGTCAGSISDNDLKLDAIASGIVGRRLTSTELSRNYKVTLRIKNLDDAPASGYTVSYKLNADEWVSEQVNVTIPGGATFTHTFSKAEDLSALGSYKLLAAVTAGAPDKVKSNDTLFAILRQLGNQPIDLTHPFIDKFEKASPVRYTKDTIGLAGIDRYDFADNSSYGSLKIDVSPYNGSKVLYFNPKLVAGTPSGVQSVTGTYNLERYDANVNDIRLNLNVLGFYNLKSENKLWVRGSDDQEWIEIVNFSRYTHTDTSFTDIELTDSLLKYGQNFTSSFQLKWTISPGGNSFTIRSIILHEAFDDVHLMRIEDAFNQSCGAKPLGITIRNSSNRELTNVPVCYLVEGQTWISENITSISPNTTIQYTFSTPLIFNIPGAYSVKVLVDFPSDNNRANDTLATVVNYTALVTTFPYLQNFENGTGGWFTSGTNSAWKFGVPASEMNRKAASGTNAWKTVALFGRDDWENYLLYSPCFEIGNMTNPTLSFSVSMDLAGMSDTIMDVAWVEYSIDNENWEYLVDMKSGTNWYDIEEYQIWGRQKKRWHVATAALPKNTGVIRFRFIKVTYPDLSTEGIAIDDIHIYDREKEIYSNNSPSKTITNAVAGNDWVHFEDEGKLIASINPNGQDFGITEVKAFIHAGQVRTFNQQYYHNRNFTFKSGEATFADSVSIRLYFLDNEAESLIGATGCNDCEKPESAYELGISKYSDPDRKTEYGDLCDDSVSNYWSFIPKTDVSIVPFQDGYYAEFKVKSFSEFWFNNGGVDKSSSLGEINLPVFNPVLITAPGFSLDAKPAGGVWSGNGVIDGVFHPATAGAGTHTVTYTINANEGCEIRSSTAITVLPVNQRLVTMTAEKKDREAIIKWSTEMETTIVRYEVEVSSGEADLQASRYMKIGVIAARGGLAAIESYSFTDTTEDKFGIRKYRLKMIHSDGSSTYSDIVSLQFPDAVIGIVYPNPSRGLFQLLVNTRVEGELLANVYDGKGILIKKYRTKGNGGMQKLVIDLSSERYASGIYLLQTVVDDKKVFYKLHRL